MVQQVLQRFDFTYSSPQATPLSTRHSLSDLPSDEYVEPSGPYPELVGCLMYLMTCTRPDLAHPLTILGRYVALGRHRPEHMAAAKRVLRYLCSTSGMGLVLGGRRPVVLTGHADASWADDQASQRSSQGYTFSLGSGSVSLCGDFVIHPELALFCLTGLVFLLVPNSFASSSISCFFTPDRRGKRPAEDNFGEGTSGVEVLLGSNSRAPSEEARATVKQSHEPPADERVAARQPRVPVKSTPTDADGDAGQSGPTLQKRQKAATPVEAAPVNPLASLTAQQMQALLSMLQQHAPVTIAISSDYISAPAKIENQKEVTAPRANKAARVNDTTAAPLPAPVPAPIATQDDSDDSEKDDGEAPNNITRRRIIAPAPSLPPLNPTPAPTTFMRKGVRDQAEVFSAIQAHLKHVNFKLQHGDVESALANVAEIESLIHKRFEVLLVADEAGFEAAGRFQLYQSKSVLTSRSYKLAIADVAALKHARAGYSHGNRMPTREGETEGKGVPSASCHEPRFKGVCFRCGQPGHMANACPMGGRGAQGPHQSCEEAHGAAPLATMPGGVGGSTEGAWLVASMGYGLKALEIPSHKAGYGGSTCYVPMCGVK
ncbi:unnamed protein product [Closterium sp. NIES-54]